MLFSSSFPARNLKEIAGRIFVRGECRHQLAMVMVKNPNAMRINRTFFIFQSTLLNACITTISSTVVVFLRSKFQKL